MKADARYMLAGYFLGAALAYAVVFGWYLSAAAVLVAIILFIVRYGPKRWKSVEDGTSE